YDNLKTLNILKDKTNIDFEYSMVPEDGYAEKKNLAFANDDLPDVFLHADLKPSDEVKYGKQGMLIPLEELIDKYAPNLKKIFKDDPEIKQTLTAQDGHIYTLPKINA